MVKRTIIKTDFFKAGISANHVFLTLGARPIRFLWVQVSPNQQFLTSANQVFLAGNPASQGLFTSRF
jgi:hypothetical protein